MQEARSVTTSSGTPVRHPSDTPETVRKPKLLDRLRESLRSRHYSRRKEQTYCLWIKGFIFSHNKWHPADMAQVGINAFLNHMAVKNRFSASTQTQALSAALGQQ
ncbi:MAG: phage integrase N-terminal SAM-like domain-containing protein [Deltaproteobacteria bacterium]|nr:phage integrase N-terminal SAM-like domain-containing protein [Deltaproteobacteria bacterium]